MRDRELPLRRHLEELRRRLTIAALTTVATTVVAFIFYKQIVRLLLIPADNLGPTSGVEGGLVFIEVTEMIAVTMKVSLVSGLVLAFPMILYQIIMFAAPGMTSGERRYVFTFMPGIVLAFVGGVAFGYFVLIPPAINFLLNWGSDLATPMIRIGNYINVMVMLLFWMGVVFETPIVMFLLAKLGIVSHKGFAKWRRHWVVIAFILGALITPTFDPINQALVAAPLIVLYEAGIWLARLASRGRPETVPGVATPGT